MASEAEGLVLSSLRGGLNDTDVPSALAEDQCTVANNVEFFFSQLGERRNGCGPLDITGSDLDDEAVVVHISQWFPTNIPTSPEYVAIGATAATSVTVAVRSVNLTWNEITTITDAFDNTAPNIYGMSTQALNGKLFISYNNTGGSIDRLHKYIESTPGDSSTGSIIRTGLAQPNPPTAADSAPAGTYAGVRYFRVRYIHKTGSVIISRSEPSTVLTFTPAGNKTGAVVTKPATITEGETDWELEASTDNVLFYRIATAAVGTTTITDTTAFATGYSAFPLSDAIGAYLLQPNAKFLAVDGDRLIGASHWSDKTRQSQVWWSAVTADPGVGNEERLPIVTTGGLEISNSTNVDNYANGPITGIAAASFGVWYMFKWTGVYQANRTSDVTRAYDIFQIHPTVGAIPGSIIKGTDESGTACIYFLDPTLGPCRVGPQGIQQITGVRTTWGRVYLKAAKMVCHGTYYPYKQQIKWWVAVDGLDSPSLGLTLQVSELRVTGTGTVGRGWSTSTGRITEAYCSTTLTELVTVNGVTTITNRPFVGLTSTDYIQRCDTLSTDAGVTYTASIITRPFIAAGLLNRFGAMNATLLATQNASSSPTVRFIRDMGVETNTPVTASLTPVGAESQVIVDFDSLRMSEARMIQVQFSD